MTIKRYAKPAGIALLAGYIVISAVIIWRYAGLESRMHAVEMSVQNRDRVDPLTPEECGKASGMGDTRDAPCWTTFARLHQAPQQFNGRWVKFYASYSSGFETSALFAPSDARRELSEAIWAEPGFKERADAPITRLVSGKFRWGPYGHMNQYFGELVDSHFDVHNP